MKKITVLLLSIGALAGACKKKLDRPLLSPKAIVAPLPQTGPNEDGSPDTGAPTQKIDTPAIELYETVLAGMKAKHQALENQSWFASRSEIGGDWIAHSPKAYWGKGALELPAGYDCKKGSIGCDMLFERKLCSTDVDCASSRTVCLPLEASVAKPGEKPRSMCLGSGDKLIDEYYATIIKTENHLELSSLTLPSGRFRKAMINGLTYLSHKNAATTVRILISSVGGVVLKNKSTPPKKVMDQILEEVTLSGGDVSKIKMNLAYLAVDRATSPSWNHTKIVLADSNHILQGGHNFLDPDYISEQPIFDLSMHASGSAGLGVQKFVDLLWTKANPMASNFGVNEKIVPPTISDKGVGKSLTIGMGRMGDFGDDPSDEGFRILLKSAKKSIVLAQQDIYNNITTLKVEAPHALPELVDAILRGVHVKIAQSSSTKFLGYGTVAPEDAAKRLIKAVSEEAKVRKFVPPNNLTLSEYICQTLEYAPFLFSPNVLKWANGTEIGVHPKLIIIDETGFYLGSQNFYPSDLQEFGLFVSDTAVTAQLLDQYWNKIWANSSRHKVPCR